jgi:hypothetical protein
VAIPCCFLMQGLKPAIFAGLRLRSETPSQQPSGPVTTCQRVNLCSLVNDREGYVAAESLEKTKFSGVESKGYANCYPKPSIHACINKKGFVVQNAPRDSCRCDRDDEPQELRRCGHIARSKSAAARWIRSKSTFDTLKLSELHAWWSSQMHERIKRKKGVRRSLLQSADNVVIVRKMN